MMKLFDITRTASEYLSEDLRSGNYIALGLLEILRTGRIFTLLPLNVPLEGVSLKGGGFEKYGSSTEQLRSRFYDLAWEIVTVGHCTAVAELMPWETADLAASEKLFTGEYFRTIVTHSSRFTARRPETGEMLSQSSLTGFLRPAEANRQKIEELIENAGPFPIQLCVFCESSTVADLETSTVVEESRLIQVGRSARFAILGAFDWESYLVWSRDGLVDLLDHSGEWG